MTWCSFTERSSLAILTSWKWKCKHPRNCRHICVERNTHLIARICSRMCKTNIHATTTCSGVIVVNVAIGRKAGHGVQDTKLVLLNKQGVSSPRQGRPRSGVCIPQCYCAENFLSGANVSMNFIVRSASRKSRKEQAESCSPKYASLNANVVRISG